MTVKLLGGDESAASEPVLSISVDQIALRTQTLSRLHELNQIERAASVDLIVAYEPHSVRTHQLGFEEHQPLSDQLRRLGIIRARPGIGFAASVHLERCAAPARVLVTDSPDMAMLGGLGMFAIEASDRDLVDVLSSGQLRIKQPLVLQVSLSGHLSSAVSARDVVLELQRLGIAERIAALGTGEQRCVVLEFSGPGLRTLSVWDRALLCSLAKDVGALTALAACDEKTEHFLRDQRRSKAYRQLAPDAGSPCCDALCLDLSTVPPLVALANGSIVPVSEALAIPIREVVLGGDVSANLRDLFTAAAWFKTKRISSDVDVLIAPATHQVLEAIASTGTLAQLLSVGARLIEPDSRLLTGEWHAPVEGQSLRSFAAPVGAGWHAASLETCCMSAIAGELHDPRTARKVPKASLPRELPIDDSLLYDRKPTTPTTILPPPRRSEPAQPLRDHRTPLAL